MSDLILCKERLCEFLVVGEVVDPSEVLAPEEGLHPLQGQGRGGVHLLQAAGGTGGQHQGCMQLPRYTGVDRGSAKLSRAHLKL